MGIHREKRCMQDNGLSVDFYFFRRLLNYGLVFWLFIAFGAITPALSIDSDVFKISNDTFSIGETWVYRDNSNEMQSDGVFGHSYTKAVYHNIRIIDKIKDRDSSFYICEIADSGRLICYSWGVMPKLNADSTYTLVNYDTTYETIVMGKEIDTIYRSPFNQSFFSWVYSSDSIDVHKCVYMNDTLFLNEEYQYLEKYGFFHCFRYEPIGNTWSYTINFDLISHNGVLFDTSAILPLNLNNRNILQTTSPKKPVKIFLCSNHLIINDEENNFANQKSYALYSIDGRLLQKGFYENNAEIALNFIRVSRSLIVKLGTGSSFSVIQGD